MSYCCLNCAWSLLNTNVKTNTYSYRIYYYTGTSNGGGGKHNNNNNNPKSLPTITIGTQYYAYVNKFFVSHVAITDCRKPKFRIWCSNLWNNVQLHFMKICALVQKVKDSHLHTQGPRSNALLFPTWSMVTARCVRSALQIVLLDFDIVLKGSRSRQRICLHGV